MKRIKLLKDWESFKAGTLLDVDEMTATMLCADGSAELYDAEADKKAQAETEAAIKAEQERIRAEVKTVLDAELKNQEPARKVTAAVIVKERVEDDPKGGFKSFCDFCLSVYKAGAPGARPEQRLLAHEEKVLVEGTPALGGFLVPEEFRAELLRRTYEVGQIMSRCRQIPMASNVVKIPTIAETTRVDGSRYGGVTTYWTDESTTKTPADPAFGQIELKAKKLTGLIYTSDELLQDSAITLETLLSSLFSEELSYSIEEAIIFGTGAGRPLGIMLAPCLVTVAADAGQATATLTTSNLVRMWARMWGRSRSNAVWIFNQDIEPQLLQMSLAVGTGGLPVYLPPNGLSASPFGTLFGRPALPSEHCQTLGTTGDIILADFSQYLLATKGGIETATSIHVAFVYDRTAFRFVIRVDGQPWWASALTPAKGANTLSPFIALAARP